LRLGLGTGRRTWGRYLWGFGVESMPNPGESGAAADSIPGRVWIEDDGRLRTMLTCGPYVSARESAGPRASQRGKLASAWALGRPVGAGWGRGEEES